LKVFLHIFDQDRLSHALGEWTPGISLAVAVSEEGAVHFQIHHVSEEASLPAMIVRRFGVGEGDLVVSQDAPQTVRDIVGEVRKVRFSEEKRMLDLVLARPGLPEEAADYAINFAFSREEGIEVRPTPSSPEDAFGTFPEKLYLTDGFPDAGLEVGLLHFRAERETMRWCGILRGRSRATEDGLLLICGGADGAADGDGPEPIRIDEVHHREDLSEFIAPRAEISGWRHPDAFSVLIDWDLLPPGLRDHAGRAVSVRLSPWWMAFSPDLSADADAPPVRNPPKPAAAGVRLSGAILSMAISAVVASGVSLGAIAAAGLLPEFREGVAARSAPAAAWIDATRETAVRILSETPPRDGGGVLEAPDLQIGRLAAPDDLPAPVFDIPEPVDPLFADEAGTERSVPLAPPETPTFPDAVPTPESSVDPEAPSVGEVETLPARGAR
jgi:hypothetical protein